MTLSRKFVRNVAAAAVAIMVFVQTNLGGLPIDSETKSWVMFSSGAAIAGLTVFKLREDQEEVNQLIEAGSIAESGRLEAERKLNDK